MENDTAPVDAHSHVHKHDGVVEFTIPPWIIYFAVAVGAGLATWLAYDLWQEYRRDQILRSFAVTPFPLHVHEGKPEQDSHEAEKSTPV